MWTTVVLLSALSATPGQTDLSLTHVRSTLGLLGPRRAGDPAQIVADCSAARTALGWRPHFDDLSTIVAHALAWERELIKRGAAKPNERVAASGAGSARA